MLGARLKSWVEAQLTRARRRKHKQSPARAPPRPPAQDTRAPPLSSPESAYSTGYSTDGTSPGGGGAPTHVPPAPRAPPPTVRPAPPPQPPLNHIYHEPIKRRSSWGHRRTDSGGWIRPLPPPPPGLVAPAPAAPSRGDASATPSPRPRCRIRTNPWMSGGTSPVVSRHPGPSRTSCHTLAHLASPLQHRLQHARCCASRIGGVCGSSDEECGRFARETAILSDADCDTDADTGLDGGDEREPEDELDSPARRRARRRRPPRRSAPRSAGATPPRARRARTQHQPALKKDLPALQADPLIEADREAERQYRSLIREAERLLTCVSRAPLEPPHNPRVQLLRAGEAEPRGPAHAPTPRSPDRTHLTNFIRANSPPAPLDAVRRESPLARASIVPPPPAPRVTQRAAVAPAPAAVPLGAPCDRPHSEPPKRKSYARDVMLVQTLEGLKRSLEQQSALLACQTHAHRVHRPSARLLPHRDRLDSL